MPKVMTLSGPPGLGEGKKCKCIRMKNGGKRNLCYVGKSKKHRSGWTFVKGGC